MMDASPYLHFVAVISTKQVAVDLFKARRRFKNREKKTKQEKIKCPKAQ